MAERGRAPGRTQGYAGTWPPREAARARGWLFFLVWFWGCADPRDTRERPVFFVWGAAEREGRGGKKKGEGGGGWGGKAPAPGGGFFLEWRPRLHPPLAPLRPGSY